MNKDQLLTVTEAAEILSVCTRTLKRWAKSGQLKIIVMPGRQYRITRAEVDRLAANVLIPEQARPEA